MASVSEFLRIPISSGYGSDYSDGHGDCKGNGSGYGAGGEGDGFMFDRISTYGYGYGGGAGRGYRDADGNGFGSGNGNGFDDGTGFGEGYGAFLKSINGNSVYYIDGVATVITSIHGNLAKGFVVGGDFQLTACYVAKGDGYFAHGKTRRDAIDALSKKILENTPIEEKISNFVEKFPEYRKKYPVQEFYDWHHILTGSCEFGRNQFMKNHNINMEDEKTVEEFIELTQNDYGREIIRQLKERYEDGTDGRKANYTN